MELALFLSEKDILSHIMCITEDLNVLRQKSHTLFLICCCLLMPTVKLTSSQSSSAL
jgi:hypothetical protein